MNIDGRDMSCSLTFTSCLHDQHYYSGKIAEIIKKKKKNKKSYWVFLSFGRRNCSYLTFFTFKMATFSDTRTHCLRTHWSPLSDNDVIIYIITRRGYDLLRLSD